MIYIKIFQKIKQIFSRRALYLVHYFYCDEEKRCSGYGTMSFKSFPKINSFKHLSYIETSIQEKFDNPNNVKIVIKNIIRLD